MALYAAQHYGCKVTTTTLSKEQFAYTEKRIAALGLQDQVTLLLQDYRDLTGQYDKLVSIEMIEAVGHRFLPTYFKQCAHLLKSDGLMFVSIGKILRSLEGCACPMGVLARRMISCTGCQRTSAMSHPRSLRARWSSVQHP